MAIPPKRKPNRSQRRAEQRSAASPAAGPDDAQMIPAPPAEPCPAWHWYWCEGHNGWHHHDEAAVEAIQAGLSA